MRRKYIAHMGGCFLLATVLSACGSATRAQQGGLGDLPTPPPAPTYAPAAKPQIAQAPELPALVAANTTIFADQFDAQRDTWQVRDISGFPVQEPSRWQVEEGRINQITGPEGAPSTAPTALINNAATGKDYTIQAMGYSHGNSIMGLVGRVSDQGYYALVVLPASSNTSEVSLQRYDAATERFTLLAKIDDGGWTKDSWYALGLSFKGDQIIGMVNGQAVISATDSTLSEGAAGVYGYGEGQLAYDRFVVSQNQ